MTCSPCPDAFPSRFSCTSFTATLEVCFPHYIHSLGTFQLGKRCKWKRCRWRNYQMLWFCLWTGRARQASSVFPLPPYSSSDYLSVVEFEQLSAISQEYHTMEEIHTMEEKCRCSSVRQSTFKVRPTGPLSIGSGPSDLFPLKGYRYSQT